jgi:exportin-T
MTGEKRAFLEMTLGILIDKLKWDEDDEPDDMDQDDQMMFENMRKVISMLLVYTSLLIPFRVGCTQDH